MLMRALMTCADSYMAPYLSAGPDLFYQINSLVAVSIGLPINCLLLWLISNKSPKDLRVYGRVLKVATYVDLFLLLTYYCYQPVGGGNYMGKTNYAPIPFGSIDSSNRNRETLQQQQEMTHQCEKDATIETRQMLER